RPQPSDGYPRAAQPGDQPTWEPRVSGSSCAPFPDWWPAPHRVARLVAPVTLFFPWITIIVVAKRLPEARFIPLDQSEAPDPLGALPEVEMRYKQPRRSTMFGSQRLPLVAEGHPGFSSQHIGERQIRRVVTIAVGDDISGDVGVIVHLLQQGLDGDAFPMGIEFGPLGDTTDVDGGRLMGQGQQLLPGPSLRFFDVPSNREIPPLQWRMRGRP